MVSTAQASRPPPEVLPDLLHFQYSSWAPLFERHTFRGKTLELPSEFVAYLDADGVYLPEENEVLPPRGPITDPYEDYQDWEDCEIPAIDNDEEFNWQTRFPGLVRDIVDAIRELGGPVIPRLNWSCPSDAAWISVTKTLACTSADEVLLLLKSSDRVSHDLSLAAEFPRLGVPQPPIMLTLRKWFALRPEREFRCFVRGHRLVGLCQRDTSQHFPQLQDDVDEFRQLLCSFHQLHVANKFPLPTYTYDVYITTSGRVRLVDFNPAGGTTRPLLFSWQELGMEPGQRHSEGGQTQPESGETQPERGQMQSDSSQTQPESGQMQPEGGQTQSDSSQTQPELGKAQPGAGQSESEAGQTHPFGEAPAASCQTEPETGQMQAGSGHTPEESGQVHLAAGRTRSAVGQAQSNLSQTQPDSGQATSQSCKSSSNGTGPCSSSQRQVEGTAETNRSEGTSTTNWQDVSTSATTIHNSSSGGSNGSSSSSSRENSTISSDSRNESSHSTTSASSVSATQATPAVAATRTAANNSSISEEFAHPPASAAATNAAILPTPVPAPTPSRLAAGSIPSVSVPVPAPTAGPVVPNDWRCVPLRIVQQPGMIQPGQHMATGMPFDMLLLQDSMEDVIRRMQQEGAR